jgi:hypothetical protein
MWLINSTKDALTSAHPNLVLHTHRGVDVLDGTHGLAAASLVVLDASGRGDFEAQVCAALMPCRVY